MPPLTMDIAVAATTKLGVPFGRFHVDFANQAVQTSHGSKPGHMKDYGFLMTKEIYDGLIELFRPEMLKMQGGSNLITPPFNPKFWDAPEEPE